MCLNVNEGGKGLERLCKSLILFALVIYDEAHRRAARVFNKLALAYDQAHGVYGEAHACKIRDGCKLLKTGHLTDGRFCRERVYG